MAIQYQPIALWRSGKLPMPIKGEEMKLIRNGAKPSIKGSATSNLGGIRMRHVLIGISLAAFALVKLLIPSPAIAQDYPNRPVTIIVPLAAGSGMDTVVRSFGEKLSRALGKPVLIENQTGGSAMIAIGNALRAPADGHTILVAPTGAMAINPVLFKKINFDPVNDFVPIAAYANAMSVILVNPELPARSFAELITLAKASAPPLSYSTPGVGSPHYLTMEILKQRLGVNLVHVPYRSSVQGITDIVGGHVLIGVAEVGASLPLVNDKKLRALAVSTAVRIPSLPDTPTIAEALNLAEFETGSWHTLFVRSTTPREIVDRLHRLSREILSSPEIKKLVANLGLLPMDPPAVADIQSHIKSEQSKWRSAITSLGIDGSQ